MSLPPHSREFAERGPALRRRRRQLVVWLAGGGAIGLILLAVTPPEQAFVLPLRAPTTGAPGHVDPSMLWQHKPLNLDTQSQSAQLPAINDIIAEMTGIRDFTKSRQRGDAASGDSPAIGPEIASYGGGLTHASSRGRREAGHDTCGEHGERGRPTPPPA
ncbi:hypothetical protein [Sphaerimonospora mesophila]|uniref:hypothetical protein n=1 Tax=Sphaerimonospora mesophila TaxID=37483 RepID=UPI000A650CDE